MTFFLPAGMILDNIKDLTEKIAEVRAFYEQRDMLRLKDGISEMEEIILEMAIFLERLSCQPLIYIGKGKTEEVIRRLDWALTFIEEEEAAELIRQHQELQSG